MRRIVLVTALLLSVSALADTQVPAPACNTTDNAPAARLDERFWQATALRIEVLANDSDPRGRTLTVTSVASPPPNLGSASVSADQKAVNWTPGASPAAGEFQYTISNGSSSATGTIRILADAQPAGPTLSFTYHCDDNLCFFGTTPPQGVRNYKWTFPSAPECDKEWANPGRVCRLPYGSHSVNMTVNFYDGKQTTVTQPVTVSSVPANALWTNVLILDGQENMSSLKMEVRIDSTNKDRNGVSHTFDFGDGTPIVGATRTNAVSWQLAYAEHVYRQPGSYIVKLIVTDEFGVVTQFPKTIQVLNTPPIISNLITTKVTPDVFDFSAYVDDELRSLWSDPLRRPSVEWNFGDGTVKTEPMSSLNGLPISTRHQYRRRGTYTMTLNVRDSLGLSASQSREVVVTNAAPVPSFTFTCKGPTGRVCTFDASATTDDTGPLSYRWIFGGGVQETTSPQTSFTFDPTSTNAEVWLYVSDGDPQMPAARAWHLVSFSAVSTLPMAYYPLTPCRLWDVTLGDQERSWVQYQGRCGLPLFSDNRTFAVALHVAVLSPTGRGTFVIDADGLSPAPSTYKTIRFSPETAPVSTNVVAVAKEFGVITPVIENAGTARLIIDVVGYFADSVSAPPTPPLLYEPIEPCVIRDSRTAPPKFVAGTTTYLAVKGKCGVPQHASAAALGVTAVNPSNQGHLRIFSSLFTTAPYAAMLNFRAGTTRVNSSITSLGGEGLRDVGLASSASFNSDYVVDVHGYFSPSARLKYVPVSPCQVISEDGGGGLLPGRQREVKVAGNCGVPVNAEAAFILVHTRNADGFSEAFEPTDGWIKSYASRGEPSATDFGINAAGNRESSSGGIVRLSRGAHSDLAFLTNVADISWIDAYVMGYFIDPSVPRDGDNVSITWTTGGPFGRQITLDVTSLGLDPLHPDYFYYVNWGETGAERWTASTGQDLLAAALDHVYAKSGYYQIDVVAVRRSDGAETKFSRWVTVNDLPNQPPVARLVFDCTYGRTCEFDASTSTDDSGQIREYRWTFGDGSNAVTTTATTSRAYAADGTYAVTLIVWDGDLSSSTLRRAAVVVGTKSKVGYVFHPITPCRAFDSRNTGTRLTHGVARTVPIGGTCGIPAAAKAVATSTTVVSPSASGWLKMYKNGEETIATVLDFAPATSPRGMHVTVALDAAGALVIKPGMPSGGNLDVIVDVTGFYAVENSGITPAGVGFRTLTPCRIIDSRNDPPGALVNPTWLSVKLRGKCGLPDSFPNGVAAAAMNLTAVLPAAEGVLMAIPSSSSPSHDTSSLHVLPERTQAAGLALGLGLRATDDVSLKYSALSGSSTHWIIDTTGYWATGNELRYYPIPGCRILDTARSEFGFTRLAAGVEVQVQARGNCGIPSWAKAVMIGAHAVLPEAVGNLNMYPGAISPPRTSVLNWRAGDNSIANMAIVPVSESARPDLALKSSFSGADVVLDVFGYFANPSDMPAGYSVSEDEEEK